MKQLKEYIQEIDNERRSIITSETLKLLNETDEIDGWLYSDEIMLLHHLAKDIDGLIVEIGSWKGKSATAITSALKNGELYCIDTFKGSKEHDIDNLLELFIENTKKYEDKITYIPMMSKYAAEKFDDDSIDMLFIDGSHEYKDVKSDLELYFKKVKPNGVILIHDTKTADADTIEGKGWKGPIKASNEFIENNKYEIKEICGICSTTCFRKT